MESAVGAHLANAAQGAVGLIAAGGPAGDPEHHNIPATASPDSAQAMAGKLAAKLVADGVTAGITLADMELGEDDAEKYIRDAILHLDTPGTPSD